jgi:hypothetical protein
MVLGAPHTYQVHSKAGIYAVDLGVRSLLLSSLEEEV